MLPLQCHVYALYMSFKFQYRTLDIRDLFSLNQANLRQQLTGNHNSCWHHGCWLLADLINSIVSDVEWPNMIWLLYCCSISNVTSITMEAWPVAVKVGRDWIAFPHKSVVHMRWCYHSFKTILSMIITGSI